jgi:hypothetical protein
MAHLDHCTNIGRLCAAGRPSVGFESGGGRRKCASTPRCSTVRCAACIETHRSLRHPIQNMPRPHTTETYTASLLAAERDGDVMRTMEVVTEARVLKLDLPPAAIEAGIRTFAAGGSGRHDVSERQLVSCSLVTGGCWYTCMQPQTLDTAHTHLTTRHPPGRAPGGQWQRAVDMMQALTAAGAATEHATAQAVFKALADGQQADRALQLFEALLEGGAVSSPVRNLVSALFALPRWEPACRLLWIFWSPFCTAHGGLW